ncbi:hypothetical protein KAR91_40920 [Candidatus Pacearchaeota archaeon]|nr:hypothetical protein [Candidatus Pacearchaeota archaeon]
MKIQIKKSKNADTRTCDVSKVNKEELLVNSKQHIEDVKKGMRFYSNALMQSAYKHDLTKLTRIDQFHDDFKNGFKEGHQTWWEMHQKTERHHLKNEKYIQEDVNLIDILEMITDGVMAGLARSGEYRKEDIPSWLLEKAFNNTIELLLSNVEVEN